MKYCKMQTLLHCVKINISRNDGCHPLREQHDTRYVYQYRKHYFLPISLQTTLRVNYNYSMI